MPKILILDIDGVVITGRPSDGKVWHTDLEQDLGVSYNDILNNFFAPSWHGILSGKSDMKSLLTAALTKINAPCTTQQFIDYWFKMDAKINAPVLVISDKYHEQGIPTYLCTNQEPLRKQYLWQQLGLNNHFDGIFSSCDFGVAKPEVEYYQIIQNKLAITNPHDIIFFDDREHFVTGAIKAGWDAHIFTNANTMAQTLEELL